ncbi:MAG TPA: helix-turn-helix domain-containing protein [Mucilaginibacter sp.]|jgi:AraC-like DNA-binding protein
MMHKFFNDQTRALFNLIYQEPILSREFYGRDHEDKLLTIAWNRGIDQKITIDNVAYTFSSNTIHCLMVSESFHFENPADIVAWQFNRDFYCIVDHDKEVSCVGFIFYGPPQKMFIHLSDTDQKKLDMILQMLQDEFETHDHIQGEMMQVLLKRLIIIVTRLAKNQFINENELPGEKLDIVRKYNFLVESHYRTQHKVKFYADQLYKSPKTLSNLFALYNNKNPLLVIQERIIMEAKRLMFYTDKTIKEISYELGFEDAGHFGKFFKRHTGMVTSDFKKMNMTGWRKKTIMLKALKTSSGKVAHSSGSPAVLQG